MKWFADLSIFKKLILVFISTFVILGLLISIFVWQSLDVAMTEQFQKRGIEIATRLASMSSEHILFNDPIALFEVADEVQKSSEEIRYVLILDHRQRLLAHTFSDALPRGILELNATNATDATNATGVTGDTGATDATGAISVAAATLSPSVIQVDSNEGPLLDIKAPIEAGRVGYARIGISENNIRGYIQEKIREIFLITLLVSLAATLLTARLTAFVTRPIRDLSAAAGEIAKGNTESRVSVGSRDEIGRLAVSFNNMADSLAVMNRDREALLTSLKEKEKLRGLLLNKLIVAQENERRRISRELHDETSQALTSLIVSTRLLADSTADQKMQSLIKGIRDVAARIMSDIRNLAVELRPPSLDDLGLQAAMERYIQNYREHYGIEAVFSSSLKSTVPDSQIALTLYRIMQEGLTNVARHSGASHVEIKLEDLGGALRLTISDDGRGITDESLRKARESNHIGIYGMKERAELCGGTFRLMTDRTGTAISVTIPLAT